MNFKKTKFVPQIPEINHQNCQNKRFQKEHNDGTTSSQYGGTGLSH